MSQDRGIDLNESITVEAGGVTVTKEFAPEEFEVPAIRFELRSEHDEPVLVRLTDMIPEEFPMDGVGFHPDYDGDRWTAYDDGRVEFERTLDGGESLVTVYGVRVTEPEDVAPFLTEPYFEVAAGEDAEIGTGSGAGESLAEHDIDDIVPEENTGVVREFITGARDAVPGLEEETAGAVDEPDAPDDGDLDLELDDPVAEDDPSDSEGDSEDLDLELEDPDQDAEAPSDPENAPDPIPLEDEDESEEHVEDRATVEESALEPDAEDVDVADEPDGPAEPEPDALDDAVARTESTDERAEDDAADDVRDPSSARETADDPDRDRPSPLEECDTVAAALASELRAGDVSEDDLAILGEAFAARDGREGAEGRTATQLRHLQGRVSELEAYADAFGEFIDENGTGDQILEDVQDRMDALESELEEELERTSDRLAAFDERLDAVDDRVEELAADHGESLDAIEDDLREVRSTLADADDDLADLRDDVDDLREWRERLGSMFSE